MVQRHAIKLLERIHRRRVGAGCRQLTIQRHALGQVQRSRTRDVDTLALLHVPEVNGVNTASLVGHYRGLHMSDESPLCRPKKRVRLDVRRPRPSSQTPSLVLDEQFPNKGFT